MKRVLITLIVVVTGLCAGIGGYGLVRRHHREAAAERARQERLAARTPLQRSAADIDLARRAGRGEHFAILRQHLPPGLVAMEPVDGPSDDGVVDIYSYGDLQAVVRYTADPGDRPCGEHTCIRDTEIDVRTREAPSLRHASVWLTGRPSSPAQDTAVRWFRATTTWLPTAKTGWFTQLAYEGDVEIHLPRMDPP
ncbi:hypothetical protein Aph02nite_47670 [Actinoplanes philippinensis]|uniref:Uncharacterized protein n=1 Tax=Actinoplanes philippinensis TaxID=35752 RepID=A0A1I2I402_9ACTN|nr:hypothetical protein [Actinoplanes philippinensis]GIE78817.1 hypothetical protein Aph02nite_47670 [Actinoplanes philippinensis]SFF35241.1 hypothetical protein SAMN05421541_109119 [Actinoplanes philippinensis]